MGFEAYYVDTPRQHDAGMLIVGDPLVNFGRSMTPAPPYAIGDLPKQTGVIHREATCPGECTQDLSQPITVFSALHHMHYYGQKFVTEKYDVHGVNQGGVGNRIDFWDNGFQMMQTTNYT
eukprot:3948739-Prymnesium_polylepis.3